MATETFYKRIIISDIAAEKLASGLEKPREPYKPRKDMLYELKRGEELLEHMLELRKSSEQITS